MLQDNFLFDGTIGDNIRYGRPDATLEEIREVSRIAHADEFIEAFEKKYDTIVGERGVKLSGGQRQRVAIARAILADPRILVLDEATSSLDSESEALIQDGLRSLRQGRTTFVIAHRLSTIRSADQILVLEHGEIVERGTHAELLALGGRYRTLYDKQYKFETDRFINPGEDFTPVAARLAVSRAQPSGPRAVETIEAGSRIRLIPDPDRNSLMPPQFIYTMKGLGKVHQPDHVVLKDIWLSFLPGAKIGVLGLNGAGKSTLLRIMAGEDRPISSARRFRPRASRSGSCRRSRSSIRRRRCSATSRRASPRSARC